ncbi:nicotinate-nucleotide pyrophosphorylase [carboxylating] [Hydrogenivirga caldilitoris]|uniref:Probable nicotinate-nucleotide pyrophosphorylase [carboxylating] n=1 Tax=Hydrogenivirga caldilitoris TaxID=246264 RepID=A0A497XNY1_9AQUI|nr:carboxylating nicotinate-nucleotide diphosphorylase [Hydrogenivirga caldilitoris]RLJ70676.1 nicotinate-nucleotide pyrophosphorylase [carboxylating] [Hydrogenivirga caldilitoris]
MNRLFIRSQLQRFLEEDLGTGDITTELVCSEETVRAVIKAKSDGILAGLPFVQELFLMLGGVYVRPCVSEGSEFKRGDTLIELEGRADQILMGERLALNILQSLSGIATRTREFVKALEGTGVKILDTRKTTPGYRFFEKYAVRVGGGKNHRFALYDMVLIKDNHKRVAGEVEEVIRRIKEKVSPAYKIEVEVESLEELDKVLTLGVDIVMLDNFSPEEVKEAVKLVKERAEVEVSGNITLENVKEYAVEGVNYISSGSIIYGASWCDLSLKVL